MIHFLSKARAKDISGIALLRLDFNTRDEWRMKASLPTLRFLLRTSRKIVILSHRGRPTNVRISRGIPSRPPSGFSLRDDSRALGRFLKRRVVFVPHFRFKDIKTAIKNAPKGSIFVLENLRFLAGETNSSRMLARRLASLGDFYVNDAFAVSHRTDASVYGIPQFIPSYAGLELEAEIRNLSPIMSHSKKPLVMIFGGAKAGDKLPVIRYFRRKADWFLLSGAVSNTVLRAKGLGVGKSVVDESPDPVIHEISEYPNIVLPVDYRIKNEMILDIGEKTVRRFGEKIKKARTIIWNGPMGRIEDREFRRGTLGIAKCIAGNRKAFSVAGGGETVMFLKKHGLDKKFSFISTGGGAMLEFLAGRKLPGIEALKTQRN